MMKKLVVGMIVCILFTVLQSVEADEVVVTHMPFMAHERIRISQGNCIKGESYSHCGDGLEKSWDMQSLEYQYQKVGMPIVASCSGRVVYANYHGDLISENGYGNLVLVYNPDQGIVAYFAHLTEYIVNLGEHVERGQVIGFMGNTGYSFGPHVHYQVNKAKTFIYPARIYNDISSHADMLATKITYQGNNAGIPQENKYYTSINDNLFAKRHFEGDWLNPVGEHQERGDKDIPAHGIFGNVKENPTSIHWWHTPLFGMNDWTRNYFQDGSPRNCYIQEYEGGPEQGAIVYDAFGGARRAYIVGWQQWNTWSSLVTPYRSDNPQNENYDPSYNEFHEGGPNSVCSMSFMAYEKYKIFHKISVQ